MNLALLRKMIHDSWLVLLSCAVMLFACGWVRVKVISSVEVSKIYRFAQGLPDFVKQLSPVPLEEIVNYPGMVSYTFEEPVVLLMMTLWVFTHASNAVSGELGRGTLEMILAQPIGRLRYLAMHFALTLSGILILAASLYAGLLISIGQASVEMSNHSRRFHIPYLNMQLPLISGKPEEHLLPLTELLENVSFLPALVNYVALGFFLAGVTTLLSACDRYRWRTIGIITAFFVMQLVLELCSMAIDGWQFLRRLTILSIYEPVAITIAATKDPDSAWQLLAKESTGYFPDLGPVGYDLLLVGGGFVAALASLVIFARRDLPAPL